jgi:hypothetical protein
MTIYEGAAILGALAWIPYLVKLLRDAFTLPEISIITQRTAEIGFTAWGPILNLRIAFPVRHRDIVISSIKIRVKHESGEEKVLSWQGITQRLGQMQFPEATPIPWEKEISVLAIKLSEKEVEERFIRFQENDYHASKETFDSRVAKKLSFLMGKGDYDPEEFLKSEEIKDLISFINRWPRWKQGKYTVTFEIESPEKFNLKDNLYEFSLEPMSIDLLEGNKDLIPLSYEDLYKLDIKDYKPHKPHWNWVYPILKKMA